MALQKNLTRLKVPTVRHYLRLARTRIGPGREQSKVDTLVAALIISTASLGLGVYYHNEITVFWLGWQRQPFDQQLQPVTPPALAEGVSIIEIPGLVDPLPLVYSETLAETQIQDYLKEGAVVLPLGTAFGDSGNVVVTAHSSGFEALGPYRLAFAKLSELETGQEYVITTPTARYTYRVYDKQIVWPHQVDQLPSDDRSTVTLVTCWPLWTNLQRLLVHSELVSVDYEV